MNGKNTKKVDSRLFNFKDLAEFKFILENMCLNSHHFYYRYHTFLAQLGRKPTILNDTETLSILIISMWIPIVNCL